METKPEHYQCAIIGGGLAGLCLAVRLAERGISVVVFEKKSYPFHKVCGEYISLESWDFLKRLGLPLDEMGLPIITRLGISSEKGFMLNQQLPLGGFGISRFTLDHQLSRLAIQKGAKISENCRVIDVVRDEDDSYIIKTTSGTWTADMVCGSFGKYTPAFASGKTEPAGKKYIGVKYHIRTDLAPNRIELHNFRDGYCGVSKVDQDWYCLCYLSTADSLQRHGKDIKALESDVLRKNPFLDGYFRNSDFINAEPLVISNIHFNFKHTKVKGMQLLGDAAGSITPLCGNGMSMGMRAANLLAEELLSFFDGKINAQQLSVRYQEAWKSAFSRRIMAGYYLQNLFGKKETTDLALRFLSKTPSLARRIVSLTHGQSF